MTNGDSALLLALAVQVEAGVPLDAAIATAAAGAGPAWASRASGLAMDVHAGKAVAPVLAAGGLDAVLCALIAAGETCGRLGAACRRGAELVELRAGLRTRLAGRLVHPLAILLVATTVPLLPSVVAGRTHPLLLLAPAAVLVALIVIVRRNAVRLAEVAQPLPWVAAVAEARSRADALAVLGAGLSAGLLADRALDLAAGVAAPPWRERLRVASAAASAGAPLAASLAGVGWPRGVHEALAVAETAGRLDAELPRLAAAAVAEHADAARRLMRAIAVITYVLAVVVAVGVIISVFLGYLRDLHAATGA